ncbi:unnamed protein product [Thelazia callipaeda]|uniref:Nematode cuticle collagen N-terminal domain-containing protein n=1 Tax=Thelazia callipaeda TaxID=103827 RepID=A0A0N5D6N4_THECL|nr:unnamed protein product [Thelazia callipaeda]
MSSKLLFGIVFTSVTFLTLVSVFAIVIVLNDIRVLYNDILVGMDDFKPGPPGSAGISETYCPCPARQNRFRGAFFAPETPVQHQVQPSLLYSPSMGYNDKRYEYMQKHYGHA